MPLNLELDWSGVFRDRGGKELNAQSTLFRAKGNGLANDTTPLQDWVDASSSDAVYGTPPGVLPAGKYICQAPLQGNAQNLVLHGAGIHKTEIHFVGLGADPYFQLNSSLDYFRPHIEGIRLTGDAGHTGVGLDLTVTNPTDQVYRGVLRDLWIESGGSCIYAPNYFHMAMERVWGKSLNDHVFRAHLGNSTYLLNCAGVQAGAGKALYRLTGQVFMICCNGAFDTGSTYWGIFGQDTAATDGFQNDLPDAGADYPSVYLLGCNIEHFVHCGILGHSSFRSFEIKNGQITRADLATAYDCLIRARLQSLGDGAPLEIDCSIFPGSGAARGTTDLSGSATDRFFVTGGGAVFADVHGKMKQATPSITKFWDASAGIPYPTLFKRALGATYGDNVHWFSGLGARNLSIETELLKTLTITPATASNQTVDITGYSKLKSTPTGAYSIDKFTFNATGGTGAPTDRERNGRFVFEAGDNTNNRLNHNVAGTGGMRLKGGVDINPVPAGAVYSFYWSDNYMSGVGGWIQQ